MNDVSRARCGTLDHPTQLAGWRWKAEAGVWTTTESTDQSGPWSTPAPNQARATTRATIPDIAPRRVATPSDAEKTLRMAAIRLAHVLVEGLAGKRRFGQLTLWFDSSSLAVLADRHSRWKGTTINLASVRVQPTCDHSAEVALRLTTGDLSHAVALTVGHVGGQWTGRDVTIG